MQRFTRQIAAVLTLMFAALVGGCTLVACTLQDLPVEAPKHACCPRAPKPVQHHTRSAADCPLVSPELRAGLLREKFEVAPLQIIASGLPVVVSTIPAEAVGSSNPPEPLAPDERQLYKRNRVLRI